MAANLFEDKDLGALYAQYRPTYPDIVYQTILNYYEAGKGPTCNYRVAVDVGCGTGQGTRPLTKHFQHVTGIDISAGQIANTDTNGQSNLTFRVGSGENLVFLENDSVDLVTTAQCLHWFDREAFYEEATRVLKPGGVLAAYGYGALYVDNREAQTLVDEFLYDVLGPHWEKGRWHINNMYRDISLPFPGWERVSNDELVIRWSTPVDGLVGYLSSLGHWRKYLKIHPGADHLHRIKNRLLELYVAPPGTDNPILHVTWKIFLLLGRKPQ